MYIVTATEMYDVDRYTMERIGIDGKILMENAGREIAGKVKERLHKQSRVAVLAGPGNNGGDGFVIARTLLQDNYDVVVLQAVPDEKITGDALYHKQLYTNCGGETVVVLSQAHVQAMIQDKTHIIDALFGIGIEGNLRPPFDDFAAVLNNGNQTVISVDIPSGLPADEGKRQFTAVKADYTFIVGAAKQSVFLPETSSYYGTWEVVDIGFPPFVFKKYSNRIVWTEKNFQDTMPKRAAFAHKGNHGRGLVIGGNDQMPGSILMTAKAALKTGAGLVTAGTTEKVVQMIAGQAPEAMYHIIPDQSGVLTDDETLDVTPYNGVAVGVGIGRERETEALVKRVMEEASGSVVVDADGLVHLKKQLDIARNRTIPVIITPHPGEMAMLLDISVKELLATPFQYAHAFAVKYNMYVVLKGKYTIITAPDGKQAVNITGNQGLSKGGTGDVLTGIALAMVMQTKTVFPSLCNACFLHGKSADLQVEVKHSYYDLLATDVIEGIPLVYRTCL